MPRLPAGNCAQLPPRLSPADCKACLKLPSQQEHQQLRLGTDARRAIKVKRRNKENLKNQNILQTKLQN